MQVSIGFAMNQNIRNFLKNDIYTGITNCGEGYLMAGITKELIDKFIEVRSKGNPSLASLTRTKLLLKGINPAIHTAVSEDNPEVIAKLKQIAQDMDVKL